MHDLIEGLEVGLLATHGQIDLNDELAWALLEIGVIELFFLLLQCL